MTWPIVSLGELVDITSGFAFKSEMFNSDGLGLPLVRIRDVTRGFSGTFYVGPFQDQFVVSNGDVLIGMDGEFNIAKWAGGRALLNQRVCRIDVRGHHLDIDYLFRFLPSALKEIEDRTAFVTVKHLSAKDIRTIQIPLPPLDEQRRIAAILDQADELRRKRREVVRLQESLRRSLFSEVFGDPQQNPNEWPVIKFSKLCARLTVGIVVKPASYYRESGVAAIRGTNIKSDGIDLSDVVYFSAEDNAGRLAKTRVWEGDLLIVRSGRPGLAAIVPKELNGSNSIDVLIATPNQNLGRPEFMRDFLNSDGGRRLVLSESRGQIQQHFNVGSLSEAPVCLPPLSFQDDYIKQLNALAAIEKLGDESSTMLDALFTSLQHRAFRGEL